VGYDWAVTSLRFGLKLSQDATIDQLRDLWRLADEAGFDSCWVMDHFASLGARDDGPIFETWTMLAAMAQVTTRARIGCAVVGNTYRHPAGLAKMAVTVDHLSGGRLEFGVGAGWAQNEHAMLGLEFGTRNDRADRLEESIQIIRSLWTQPRTTFEGRQYRLQNAVAEPKPVQRPHPPIWIGGSGPKRTLRIAAQYADVWNAAGGGPQDVAAASAILDRHCADVGRDPSQIRRSVQVRVGADGLDQVCATAEGYVRVGVTDFLLIVHGADPVAVGEQLAAQLPRLRELG
jgi:F420-dependent oxidoreductase-like protein